MSLFAEKSKRIFDVERLRRGTLVLVRKADGSVVRTGLLSRILEEKLSVISISPENGAQSTMEIMAKDIEKGYWEIFWTEDLVQIHHEFYGEVSEGLEDLEGSDDTAGDD